MAWFVRFTRFGEAHMVYSQEAENSCGIASVIMVNFKLKKGLIGAAAATSAIPIVGPAVSSALTGAALKAAVLAEKEVYKAYEKVSGSPYDGSTYTYTDDLAALLNTLNLGAWEQKNLAETDVAQAVIDSVCGTPSYPIILLTNWVVGGGGHFVVVDSVNTFLGTKYASICDPWDGDVHVQSFTAGSRFDYLADKPRGSWSLGGYRHEYASADTGRMKGWVVRHK